MCRDVCRMPCEIACTGRNGFEILVMDMHHLAGLKWKFSEEGRTRRSNAELPLVAWLAMQTDAVEDWGEDKIKKLDTRFAKTKAAVEERRVKLLNEWGAEEFEKRLHLAHLTVPSKKLLELRALLRTSHEDCALLRTFVERE